MPRISVVIPTFRRPGRVTRAVADALGQTLEDIEVVVVVDGLDEETRAALEAIHDQRLRVLLPPRNLGNAGARNFGIAAARGEWIALLDDDDAWAAEKLAVQMDAAEASSVPLPLVSCRLIARHERARYAWPRRLPGSSQPISEYLFCRRRPSTGEGLVQTSTILAPKALFEAVPFDEALSRYVDLDWVLRAGQRGDVGLVFAGRAPLATWSIDEDRPRISNEADWRWDVEWIRARRHLVTKRAYGAYLLTLASIRARRAEDRSAFWPLLREALAEGRVSPAELAFHLGNALLPPSLRERLTAREKPKA